MKTFIATGILMIMTLLTGCQSLIQFVDSPIPVNGPSSSQHDSNAAIQARTGNLDPLHIAGEK